MKEENDSSYKEMGKLIYREKTFLYNVSHDISPVLKGFTISNENSEVLTSFIYDLLPGHNLSLQEEIKKIIDERELINIKP